MASPAEEQPEVQIAHVEELGRRAALQLKKNSLVTIFSCTILLCSLALGGLAIFLELWGLTVFYGVTTLVSLLTFVLTRRTRASLLDSLIELNGTLHLLTQGQKHILEPVPGLGTTKLLEPGALQRRIAAGLAEPISLREREQLEELEKTYRRRFGEVKLAKTLYPYAKRSPA